MLTRGNLREFLQNLRPDFSEQTAAALLGPNAADHVFGARRATRRTRAGISFEKGDVKGRLQPCSLCIVVSGVKTRAYLPLDRLPVERIRAKLRQQGAGV